VHRHGASRRIKARWEIRSLGHFLVIAQSHEIGLFLGPERLMRPHAPPICLPLTCPLSTNFTDSQNKLLCALRKPHRRFLVTACPDESTRNLRISISEGCVPVEEGAKGVAARERVQPVPQ
jgi:hypothetical protein